MQQVSQHRQGWLLPHLVAAQEWIDILFFRWYAGSHEPPVGCSDESDKDAYQQARACRSDKIIVGRLSILLASLFLGSATPPFAYVQGVFCGLILIHILACAFYYGIASGPREEGSDRIVISLPRLVIHAVLNYLELLVLFAVIYARFGEFTYSGRPISALDPATALYFSASTASTIGYGDYAPLGTAQLFSGVEALSSLLLLAVFLARVLGSATPIEVSAGKQPALESSPGKEHQG